MLLQNRTTADSSNRFKSRLIYRVGNLQWHAFNLNSNGRDHLRWDKLVLLSNPLQGTHQATHHHSHQALHPLQGVELGGLIVDRRRKLITLVRMSWSCWVPPPGHPPGNPSLLAPSTAPSPGCRAGWADLSQFKIMVDNKNPKRQLLATPPLTVGATTRHYP